MRKFKNREHLNKQEIDVHRIIVLIVLICLIGLVLIDLKS